MTTSCAGQAVVVADNRAYLACFRNGLRVVDIARPSAMREIGSVDTPGMAYDVDVAGDRVFVADFTSGLRIIDVDRPKRPEEAGAFEVLRRAVAVVAHGDFVYAVDGQDGVSVVDVSDIRSPEEVALIEALDKTTRLGASITFQGNLLYVVDERVWVADLSVPSLPSIAGRMEIADLAREVAVRPDGLVVAACETSLQILTPVACAE